MLQIFKTYVEPENHCFKQWMYGSGSTAVASPRKPPALVSGYTEATLYAIGFGTPKTKRYKRNNN